MHVRRRARLQSAAPAHAAAVGGRDAAEALLAPIVAVHTKRERRVGWLHSGRALSRPLGRAWRPEKNGQ